MTTEPLPQPAIDVADKPALVPQDNRLVPLSLAALSLLVVLAYLPVFTADFITFDDHDYVLNNAHVSQGVSLQNVRWAFTSFEAANWHPLTWLSHMLDVSVYGLDPSGHHAMNVLLHLLGSVVLGLWLHYATGRAGAAILVASLFALHPLQVESVAWISERKNVLSTLLGLSCIWAYSWYAVRGSVLRYLVVFVLLALGLLAKPMLVTWPAVLLLLDIWPLGRTRFATPANAALNMRTHSLIWLVLEKLPLVALSIASSLITMQAQRSSGAVKDTSLFTATDRLLNALVAYAGYVRQTLCPTGLAIFYPHPGKPDTVTVVIAVVVLLTITALVLWRCRVQPSLLVGWLWFLGTLVPVIGLVQVGMQASADRYMNVPIVGLLIALVFGVLDPLALRSRLSTRTLVTAGTALCVTLAGMTFVQASYWKDSLTLYERAVAVTPPNPLMLMMVGQAYNEAQRSDEALRAFAQAVKLSPNMGRAHAFLGRQLALAGKRDEALSHLRQAATLSPKDVQVQITVGLSMNLVGAFGEAVERFEAAARLGPADETLWIHLATARAHAGRTDAAIDAATSAVRLNPRSAPSLATLASLRLFKGQYAEADALFIRAYEVDPSLWQLCKTWAEAAIGARDYNKAIKLLANYIDMQASQQPQQPGAAEAVAAARARLGEVRAAAANPSAPPLKPVVDLPKPDVR